MKPGVYAKGSFDFFEALKEIVSRDLPEDVGAVATFTGVVKSVGEGGKPVVQLEMQAYEEHANRVIQGICREVEEKHGLALVKIYHFTGRFDIGESIVFVVAAGGSRNRVFAGLREAVERYKTEPALFKKEAYADGSHRWIQHA